jgi:hypothetical protein
MRNVDLKICPFLMLRASDRSASFATVSPNERTLLKLIGSAESPSIVRGALLLEVDCIAIA